MLLPTGQSSQRTYTFGVTRVRQAALFAGKAVALYVLLCVTVAVAIVAVVFAVYALDEAFGLVVPLWLDIALILLPSVVVVRFARRRIMH